MLTLRLLSALLQYPGEELVDAVAALRQALIDDGVLDGRQRAALEPLFAQLAGDLYVAQEDYIDTFDRGRAHSLHLFEHVHGESRDRGQAMVDLRERYLAAGLEPTTNELPDFLPQFLEYCSVLPPDQARTQLAEPGVVLVALAARLEKRGSAYAPILSALCDIANVERSEDAENALPPPDDSTDLEALDEQWEEEEVRFGASAPVSGDTACPQASTLVQRMLDPVAAAPARSR